MKILKMIYVIVLHIYTIGARGVGGRYDSKISQKLSIWFMLGP